MQPSPEHPAQNLESSHITNPKTRQLALNAKDILDSGGQFSDVISFLQQHLPQDSTTTAKLSNLAEDSLRAAIDNELAKDQLAHLKSLAEPLDATVTIGEVSFYQNDFSESINELEILKNADQNENSPADSPTTYIWPGERIVK